MKKTAVALSALFFVVFINFLYEKLSRPTHFTVTADTKIIPGSELSKYVTQEEIDDFAFRYWDIDKQIQDDAFAENFRKLLKSKQTDQILKFMQDNNISIDSPLIDGVTPLMYASFYDDEATAKRLIDMGANAHAQDNYKLSPLAYAIENNSTKTARLLLDSGVRLEEVKAVQFYQNHAIYSLINSIVVDKDDVHINFDFADTDSKDAADPFGYAIANNLLEISKMLFELGYKPECKFKAQRYEEYDCFGRLSIMPNYEAMLNLLLDNNVSGQPTSEELKEAYKKCHDTYLWYKIRWIDGENINKKRPFYVDMPIKNLEKYCTEPDGTFQDVRTFMSWANEQKKMDAIIRIGDTDKVIYIDANISSQDKEKLISNKLIQKRRSKNAAERR